MNDALKHTAGTVAGGGFFTGAITLHAANEWASLACAILGSISFACTIHSWHRKQKHYREQGKGKQGK